MMNRNKIVEIIAEAICDEHGYRDAYGCANCAVDRLEKAGFLNFNLAPGASAETALLQTPMLGECAATLADTGTGKEVAGGLGETPAVRQNEQEKKVCTYCGAQNSCKRSHCIKCLKWIG